MNRLDALRQDLFDQIGEIVETRFSLPESNVGLRISQPKDFEVLLDAAAGDPEQNLPYWAEIWPSGIALADEIIAHPELIQEQRVLEIGSGIGVTASVALMKDARLTVADYSADSLLINCINSLENSGREPATMRINWREPSQELRVLAGAGFPVVLAADVLYEKRDIEPMLALVDWLVAPDGLFWLAEPGRNVAAQFVERIKQLGWTDELSFHPGPWPDPRDFNVAVTVHRLRRGGIEG